MAEPKILGRHKYEAPPLEVNLSEEIAGNLRGLKVEGNSSTLLAFLAVRDSSLGYRLRQLDKAGIGTKLGPAASHTALC